MGGTDAAALIARLLTEQEVPCSFYDETFKARDCWSTAVERIDFISELSGAMGARTKFQTKNTAQVEKARRSGVGGSRWGRNAVQ